MVKTLRLAMGMGTHHRLGDMNNCVIGVHMCDIHSTIVSCCELSVCMLCATASCLCAVVSCLRAAL